MADNQMDVAFERKDVKSSVAYIFMGFVTAMILGAIVAVNVLFAYFTHFEQGGKVLTDEVVRSKRVAYHEQVKAELQKQYALAIPNDPAEAANQAKIAFDRIRVNDFVRPPFAQNAPLEGADILSPLHSGGQPNDFTIGQENIKEGNAKLAKAGINAVIERLGKSGALKSRAKAELPAQPVWTNGGR
jgi:hypothetical protein